MSPASKLSTVTADGESPRNSLPVRENASRSSKRVLDACDHCLRRTDLIAGLAGRIEIERRKRKGPKRLLALGDSELLDLDSGEQRIVQAYRAFRPSVARKKIVEVGADAVCRCSSLYPEQLLELADPPAVLHLRGRFDALREGTNPGSIAIVGARRASAYGLSIAHAFGRDIGSSGVAVVSGMAMGIDSEAHAGALEARGLTLAVLAGGVDVPYPARALSLYRQIVQTGAVLSELPPGFNAFRWCFVARNRIIAALSQVTVIVEASARSGALSTADFAADIGRMVAAVPGEVTSRLSAGSNALLAAGAGFVCSGNEALQLIFGADFDLTENVRPIEVPPNLQPVLLSIEQGKGSLSELAETVEEAQAVTLALTELELLGVIRRDSWGQYHRLP